MRSERLHLLARRGARQRVETPERSRVDAREIDGEFDEELVAPRTIRQQLRGARVAFGAIHHEATPELVGRFQYEMDVRRADAGTVCSGLHSRLERLGQGNRSGFVDLGSAQDEAVYGFATAYVERMDSRVRAAREPLDRDDIGVAAEVPTNGTTQTLLEIQLSHGSPLLPRRQARVPSPRGCAGIARRREPRETMKHTFGRSLATALALSLASPAHADGVADEAETDFRLGVARFQVRDFEGALAWFMASNRLAPNPNVAFNIARTFEALNRLPEAHRWYLAALGTASEPALREEIEAALRPLEARVAVIEVTSDPPGATVYLDRRELGSVATTPARIAVPDGPHRVLLEREGFESVVPLDVQARIGAVASARFTLTRIVGRVTVLGDEAVAVRVDRVDGEAACTSPCDLDLEPGVHTLHGERAGFRYDPLTIRIDPHQPIEVQLAGRARTGSLVITTDERDATVSIDGRSVGFTPAVLPDVPVGERTVEIRLEGYEPYVTTVRIEEDAQAELRDVELRARRTVTTASRVEQTYADTPASVSVITPQEIAAFRYPTLADALRGQRGVSLTYDTTYHGVGVRGLGQPNDYGNRVLILQNGAVLNDNLLYQSFVGFDGRADLGDVQRIEFVRGPGSVLYGTGAVSGLVNVLTHASERPTTAGVSVSTVGDGVGRVRGDVHFDLGEANLDASVTGAYGAGRDFDITDDASGSVATVRGADSFHGISTVGRFDLDAFHVQWFGNVRNQRIPTGSYGTLLGDDRTRYRDGRGLVEVRYEPTLGARTQLFVRGVGNFYRFRGTYAYDDGAGGSELSLETLTGGWGVAEARVVSTPTSGLQIIAGAEVQASVRARLRGTYEGDPVPYLDVDNPYQIFSGYGLVEYAPTSYLRISAGLRGDVYRTSEVDFDPPFALSPRLAVVTRPYDGGVLKFLAGRAFRAPSTYELTYDDGGASQVAPGTGTLGPESVWSAEVEHTHTFAEDWAALASFHFQRAQNFIETVSAPPPDDALIVYANSSDVIALYGADLELRKEWSDGWLLQLTYGYLHAAYTNGTAADYGGSRRVASQPEHFASGKTVVPLGRIPATLAFRATLEGPRRISLDDTSTSDPGVVVDVVLSGRGFDDHLTWAFGVYDLFGWRRYLPVGDVLPSATVLQPGRSLYAEVGLSY